MTTLASHNLHQNLKPAIKQRLEPVVLELFAGSDFHQVDMRTIAKQAGIGFSTIYRYYGSKERLLFTFVDEWLAGLIDRLIDHLQGLEAIKEKLRKIIWLQLDYYEKNPNVGRIIMMTVPLKTWMADETYKQVTMNRIFLEVLKEGQEKGILDPTIPTQMLLDILYAVVSRAFTMWVYRRQQTGLAEQTGKLFNIIWRGISRP